jgi:hypothetical protein
MPPLISFLVSLERAIDLDAVPGEDLALPVKRQSDRNI